MNFQTKIGDVVEWRCFFFRQNSVKKVIGFTEFLNKKLFADFDCGQLKFLSEKLNLHSQAFQVKYIAEIPTNSSGKVVYKKLEKM